MNATLPQFLQDMLANCPKTGSDVHGWFYKCARQMHVHFPAGQIVSILEEQSRNCGRHVPRREIVSAVQDALETAWTAKGSNHAPAAAPKWPSVNAEQREAITKDGPALADLWELSPIRFEGGPSQAEQFIDALFPPGNPLLCYGKYNPDKSTEHYTKPKTECRNLGEWELIVPSPMLSVWGTTKDGKPSQHSLDATGPRRFLVVEFDKTPLDSQPALLWHLSKYAPLAMVVHSGGKSLHSWFFAPALTDERLAKFFRYAVSLGADHKLWLRSQFCRMPDGTRGNGQRQAVYYFNSATIGGTASE